MKMNENQAIESAKVWLEKDIGEQLPVVGAYHTAAKRAGEDGYYNYQPERWLVIFQCNAPEGFHPDQIGVEINQENGEIRAMAM